MSIRSTYQTDPCPITDNVSPILTRPKELRLLTTHDAISSWILAIPRAMAQLLRGQHWSFGNRSLYCAWDTMDTPRVPKAILV